MTFSFRTRENLAVALHNGKVQSMPFTNVRDKTKPLDRNLIELAEMLST